MRIRLLPTWIRLLGTIGLALCLFAAQSGCVQVGPTREPVAVTFQCAPEEESYFKPLVEAFQEDHRYITVEFVAPRTYQFPEADIFDVSPFTKRFVDEQDFELLDLTSLVEQGDAFKREELYPGLLDQFTDDDGEIWAVPYTIDVGVMYYNRDLFDRYGAAYPQVDWTWDDFLRAARALYDPDDGIFGYIPDEQKNDPLAFIYQNGGRIFDDFQNPTRTTFDDLLTIEALDWYAGLMYKAEAAPTPPQARKAYGIAGYVQTAIEQGRLGMWTGTLSVRGGRLDEEEWPFRWGVVPLPKGRESATFAYTLGYAIAGNAEHPDACWEWIDYLTRQTPRSGMPARKSIVDSKAFEEEVGQDVAQVARDSVEHALLFSPKGWDIYGTFQILNEALEKIYGGDMTAQQAMEWAQQQSQYK
jgi:ABC-type glycerol-3-phosphate transport system substrate-binding protein